MAKVLGYGHKTVRERIVREITTVDFRKVATRSGLLAAASPLIYRGIRRLQDWFKAQQGPLSSYHIVSNHLKNSDKRREVPRRINIDLGEFERFEAVGVIKLPPLRSVKHLKAYLQVHLKEASKIR